MATKKKTKTDAKPKGAKPKAAAKWRGKPVADFLKVLAKDPAKAARFASDPASVVDGLKSLSGAQREALKSGCLKQVIGALMDNPLDGNGAVTGGLYTIVDVRVTCGHPDCKEFQKHSHGK